MSNTDVQAPELSDPELISRVREGDVAAYGILFSRHVDAANRLARMLIGPSDADDLVSEGFVKVLNVLLGGGGPDVAFRAYLLTAVRRLHIDKMRSNQRLTTTDDLTPFDPGVPFTDTAVAGFEGGAAAKAFASLPERWQLVLWHLEVENQKPADIAPLLGMSPNSVSALAYRAREGLRQAFLTMHASDLVSDACRDTNDLLGGYVRGALSRRDGAKVEQHLDHCRRCTAAYLELSEVNSSLAAVLGPVLLGPAAAAYLGGGATTGIGAGILVLLDRGKDAALAHVAATAATAAVVGAAGIATIAVLAPDSQGRPASVQRPTTDRGSSSVAPPAKPDPNSRSRTDGTQRGLTGPSPTEGPGSLTAGDAELSTTQDDEGAQDDQGDTQPGDNAGSGKGDQPGDTTNPPGTQGPGGGTGSSTPTPTQPPTQPPTRPPTPDPPTPTLPTPTPPTPTPPNPTPPTGREVDVGVRAWLDSRGNRSIAKVQVTGIPLGRHVRLSATSTNGDFHQLGISCRRSGQGYTCVAWRWHSLFAFEVRGRAGATLRFSVSPPDGFRDPSMGNNSATVHVPGNQEGKNA